MKEKIWIALVGIILIMPIATYTFQFGFGLWQSNREWGEMGSAIGGIYTPILSVLTLILLIKQFQLQKSMHNHEQRATSREIVFSMVEKYAIKIESMLTQEVVDELVILSELKKGQPVAKELISKHLDIFTLWASVHAYLKNYKKDEPRMVVDLASVAVLHLTFSMCATLEQAFVTHMSDENDEKFEYWFLNDA